MPPASDPNEIAFNEAVEALVSAAQLWAQSWFDAGRKSADGPQAEIDRLTRLFAQKAQEFEDEKAKVHRLERQLQGERSANARAASRNHALTVTNERLVREVDQLRLQVEEQKQLLEEDTSSVSSAIDDWVQDINDQIMKVGTILRNFVKEHKKED